MNERSAQLEDRIRAACEEVDGKPRLECKTAFAIAEDLGVAPGDVGAACDRIGVKIRACQLGCF